MNLEATVDPVLTAPPPSFSEEEAAVLARQMFGVEGAATPVHSERDQAFLVDGERPPLVFQRHHAHQLVETLQVVLQDTGFGTTTAATS